MELLLLVVVLLREQRLLVWIKLPCHLMIPLDNCIPPTKTENSRRRQVVSQGDLSLMA